MKISHQGNERLRGCPFCGSQPSFSVDHVNVSVFQVSCGNPECIAYKWNPMFKSYSAAAIAWSKRESDTVEALREAEIERKERE